MAHKEPVTSVRFQPLSEENRTAPDEVRFLFRFLSASRDGTMVIWNRRSRQEEHSDRKKQALGEKEYVKGDSQPLAIDDRWKPAQLLETMVKDGKLGRKVGKGFYDYTQK